MDPVDAAIARLNLVKLERSAQRLRRAIDECLAAADTGYLERMLLANRALDFETTTFDRAYEACVREKVVTARPLP